MEGDTVSMIEERKDYTKAQRDALAAKGHAMPDGSFPIADKGDLKNAIHLAGNASDPAAAKAHIKKRAKALGATSMIPDDWGQQQEDGKNSAEVGDDEVIRDLRWIERGEDRDTADYELRQPDDRDGRLGTLCGHFAKFNQWAPIQNAREGSFMERIAPGAFMKTITENRASMKVLFAHGKDMSVGDKVLGPIDVLREDDVGAYYEVPLLDTSYNRDLLPGLKENLYGASFRFKVVRQKIEKRGSNAEGWPERTITEAAVKEFGPVTFPAYADATAGVVGVRSLTDEFWMVDLTRLPARLKNVVRFLPEEELDDDTTAGYNEEQNAPPETRRAPSAPVSGRRGNVGTPLYGAQKRRSPSWLLPR